MKYTTDKVSVELDKQEVILINIALLKYEKELIKLGTYADEYKLQRLCRQFCSINKTELEGVSK